MSHDYTLPAVVFNMGAYRVTGAGEGGFVSIEKKEPSYEIADMQDGDSIFSFKGSRVWIATITLSQHATANAVLSGILSADEASSRAGAGGVGIMPGALAYANGTTLIVSPAARIMGWPKTVYTNKPEDREWMIAFADCVSFIGT